MADERTSIRESHEPMDAHQDKEVPVSVSGVKVRGEEDWQGHQRLPGHLAVWVLQAALNQGPEDELDVSAKFEADLQQLDRGLPQRDPGGAQLRHDQGKHLVK